MALAMVAWMVPAWKDPDPAWKDLDLAWGDPDTGWEDQAMVVTEWEALDTAETGPDMVETG